MPVHVVAIPTSGRLRSLSSRPIARRWARAPARLGLVARSSLASRRSTADPPADPIRVESSDDRPAPEDRLRRPELPRPRRGAGRRAARAAAPVREVAEHADRLRRADPHSGDLHAARLRSRARRRHRPPREWRLRSTTRSTFVRGYIVATTSPRATSSSPTASGCAESRSTRSFRSASSFPRRGARSAGAADPRDPERRDDAGLEHGDQIFGVAEFIAFLSQAITLEPGDLILTGTPAGVGAFRGRRCG